MDLMTMFAESFDLPILAWIAEHLQCAFMDVFMPFITIFGDAGIFWIACAVVLLFIPKYRKVGLGMGIALILGLLVCNVTLKPLVQRPRPYTYLEENYGIIIPLLIEGHADFSFPSGHTIASFEAATVLLINDRKLGIPAMILAVLIAFSRLYLYMHYPTDVIASVFLGIAFAFLGNWLSKLIFSKIPTRKGKFEQ